MPLLPVSKKPPAFICSLDSRLRTVDWRLNTSLSSGCRSGSVSTSLHTLLMCDVRRSQIVSCLWGIKPPILHYNAWLTVKISPQTQLLRRLGRGRQERKQRESLNSYLFKSRPCSSTGTAFSHELAPLFLVCCTPWTRFGNNDSSILSIRDFAAALLLALISRFLSSISSRAEMVELWVTIALICGAELTCGAFILRSRGLHEVLMMSTHWAYWWKTGNKINNDPLGA